MALIGVSSHTGSLPPTSAGQDIVLSSSEPLATDASLNNPTSLASIEMEDLEAGLANSAPQNTPGKPDSKQSLLGWLEHTEIKSSPLTLVMTLLALIIAVVFGTSTWIQSSTAAEATAKANRLALFTACVSFPDQPNIVNSTFCRANMNASLDGFAKRGTAAISPPTLWDMDVLAEALQIIQPAWQCEVVCGQEMVLHASNLTLVLSIPISTGENCHLDCLEPIRVLPWTRKHYQKIFDTILVVYVFDIFSRKRHPVLHATTVRFENLLYFALGLVFLITECQRALAS
ncbi:hypothetical protein BOTCAL_0173g00050 [Botryotinia calthae]|uniref:Uncharacterized protein n=1 Tax=Botryotinia calthae TaxID=38488 RepID=A0A4Y8D1J2_9HELO|nr:hypothetical protein BOTCAL_0173g00050 [Botryotinia calthae]